MKPCDLIMLSLNQILLQIKDFEENNRLASPHKRKSHHDNHGVHNLWTSIVVHLFKSVSFIAKHGSSSIDVGFAICANGGTIYS